MPLTADTIHRLSTARTLLAELRQLRIAHALELVQSIPSLNGDSVLRRVVPPPARLSGRTTHKASSAEAILAHCLRRRGWTARFAEGRLSGKQHLVLLEDVRQYGRSWLRHEAEAFVDAYGSNPDRDDDDRPGARAALSGTAAARGEYRAGREGLGEIDRGLTGRIGYAVNRFFDRTRLFVRELMLAASEALKGEALTAIELELIELRARTQAQFLRRFEEQVNANPPAELAEPAHPQPPFATTTEYAATPPMSAAQFSARTELYANSAWQAAQKVTRQHVAATSATNAAGGVRMERRRMSPGHQHCPDCPPLAHLNWQPVGTLPDIGDSKCNGMCCCYFEYMLSEGGLETINGAATLVTPTKRPGRRRKPRIIVTVPGLPADHPPGPLSPEQLQAIIGKLQWSAVVVMGNR